VATLGQEQVDGFLEPPGCTSRQILDPENPLQFGEVLFPEWYPDYEFKKHTALADSIQVMERVFGEFGERFGRCYRPLEPYRADDAELLLVGIGSQMHTARWTVDRLRERGEKVGLVNLRSLRPFPEQELVEAAGDSRVLLVLDRDIGYGTSGMVYPDVTRAFYHQQQRPELLNFIIGLGGKDITPTTIERCVELGRGGFQGQAVFWPDARGPAEGLPYSTVVEQAASSGAFGGT
jgi:pyruvate ferredoxin oxidoreductase alpha subunit